jgi:mannose-binding lectin 2
VRVYDSVRLTSHQPSQNGWLWTKTPIHSAAWVVDFEFRISGTNEFNFGDGFAFWFVDSKYQAGKR